MNENLTAMIDRLKDLEDEIERAFEARRAQFYTEIKDGRARFDQAAIERQRQLKTRISTYLAQSSVPTLLTVPLVYGLAVPIALLDLALCLYQLGCFTAWRIPRVNRSDYIVIDRHRLAYLNGIEKLNCVYCGYANGVIAFAREVASRTEQYWCPIKHALRVKGAHDRYQGFAEYGDAKGFRRSSEAFRERLREGESPASLMP